MNTEIEILLAEDKRSDAEMTIRAIRKNKIENAIVHVTNGRAALDFLFGEGEFKNRDTSKKPKFILLDLKMPKLSGLEVLKKIRESDLTKKIPVVVLTSSKEDPDIEQCYLLGVNSYIVKPIDFEQFTEAVRDVGLYWLLLNQVPVSGS